MFICRNNPIFYDYTTITIIGYVIAVITFIYGSLVVNSYSSTTIIGNTSTYSSTFSIRNRIKFAIITNYNRTCNRSLIFINNSTIYLSSIFYLDIAAYRSIICIYYISFKFSICTTNSNTTCYTS
ncbi:hypothetical protein C1Z69_08900 [Campylobacter jejuni]|nr:hypothetical protein [Campylobacter jejuni]